MFAETPARLRSALAAALPLLLSLSTGCATSRETHRLGALEITTLRRDYTNAHLVRADGEGAFLVDAGLAQNAPLLEADLRALGVDPASLRAIVLTHGHADHAGGAAHFRSRFGTRIVAGRGDEPLLSSGHNDTLCPTDEGAKKDLPKNQNASYPPTNADVWIDRVTELRPLVGITGVVRPLPGHTEGSLIVSIGDASWVGDLFRGGVLGSSAEQHYYQCHVPENVRDIRALLDRTPRGTTFFPGHFGPVSAEAVRARFGGT